MAFEYRGFFFFLSFLLVFPFEAIIAVDVSEGNKASSLVGIGVEVEFCGVGNSCTVAVDVPVISSIGTG